MTKTFTLIIFTLLLLNAPRAKAQCWYRFTHATAPYNALVNGTEVTSGLWNDTDLVVVPVSIDLNINGNKLNSFAIIAGGTYLALQNINQYVASFGMNLVLEDRGQINGVPASPIKHTVTGAPGSRIVKIEVTNAGFKDEHDIYGTLNDFVNFQYWLYEGSNIIEIHFGGSAISHNADYFPLGCFLFINQGDDQNTAQYGLRGNPSNPLLDTLDLNSPLTSFPISGTVYRFAPAQGVNVNNALLGKDIRVYPTVCTNELTIDMPDNTTMEYEMISSNGQRCRHGIATSKSKLDISNLPGGIYYIRSLSNSNVYVYKIFKQ